MDPATVVATRDGTRRRLARAAGAILLAWAGAAAGYDYHVFGDGVQLACWQPERSRLACDFWRFAPPAPEQITARLAGRELPAPRITPYVAAPGSSAIMFLVGVGSAQEPVAPTAARAHLLGLLDAAPAEQHYGLASFAREMQMHAPIAPGPERIRNALDELAPGGEAAELYRSALEAVRLLGHYPARRRALFLLSDGLADDSAYFHDDVVDAARQYEVAIFGVGNVRDPAPSASLERLRRLAEQTGGLYVTAAPDTELPNDFATRAFAQLASGGRMQVDLSSALAETIGSAPDAVLEVYWRGAVGSASAHVPLRLAAAAGSNATAPLAVPATQSDRAPPVQRQGWLARNLLWVGIGAGLLVVGTLLAWLLRRRSEASQREPAWAETLELNARSFAYLEIQDELRTRHPISGETFRIGRHADNELMVADASISRFHAEIKHDLNSRYVIRDLESLNGIYVNGRKTRSAVLGNGDLIELGDVTLKFTLFATHDGAQVDAGDGTVTPFRPSQKRKGLRPS
jgi:hypothetical protein